MRRNKPQQLGVREGGAACGRRRAGRAGGRRRRGARCSGAGEGGGTPCPSGCPRPGQQLSPATFFPTRVVLFTNRPRGELFCLLPRCLLLGGHRVPKGVGWWVGGAAWGHTRAVEGPDGHGRQFAAFWETGLCGQHPHSQQLSLGPHVQGTQPRRHAKKSPRGEVSGLRVRAAIFFCVCGWEGEPGGRGLFGLGWRWWFLRVAGRCRVCPGNDDPRFLCFYFLPPTSDC